MESKKIENFDEQGYPTEIFINSDIVSDFMCPICLNVLRNPVVDNCQHMFCNACANQLKKKICPLSREPIENFQKVPKQLLSFLEKQKIRCTNLNKGCKWEGLLEKLQEHIDNDCIVCDKKCVLCEQHFVMKQQFDEHIFQNAIKHYYQMEKILKNKKYSTSDVMEQLLEKEIKISIHQHPVKILMNDMCWYCDSLTDAPDKICEMGHTKQHSYRKYPKFKCTQGCNRTYCYKCAYKYME